MKFGDRLKKLRKANGYSQKELGDILDLGQTTIANYEKNIRFPNPNILIKIANIFDESIDCLVGRLADSNLEVFTREELDIVFSNVLTLLLEENEQKVIKIISKLELNNERIVQLYEEVYKPVLKIIGNKWVAGEMGIAKEHYISGIIHNLMARNFSNRSLEEVGLDQDNIGNVICMSLASETHTLGIHMISDYFVILGYKSYYIGTNVPTDALVDLMNLTKPLVLAISVTIPHHINSLNNLIQVIRSSSQLVGEIGKDITIVVGGQAFNNEAEALNTGADYFANSFEELDQIFNK